MKGFPGFCIASAVNEVDFGAATGRYAPNGVGFAGFVAGGGADAAAALQILPTRLCGAGRAVVVEAFGWLGLPDCVLPFPDFEPSAR